MATVKVITANNVEIEYEVAGIGDRAVATLIDWLIMASYILVAYYFLDSIMLKDQDSMLIKISFYLPVFLYHLLCELLMEGQSFGKKVRGIKVVLLDAGQPSFIEYFLRWLLTPFEFGFGFGVVALIVCAANGKGQRLGDIAAGTTVIRLKPKASLEDTIYAPTHATNYTMRFPEVVNLTDKDMTLVKQVQRQIYKKNADHAIYYAEEAKRVLCEKLKIETNMDALEFIDVIISDYQYMATLHG